MKGELSDVSTGDLKSLIAAVRAGRLTAPYSDLQVRRIVPAAVANSVRTVLVRLEREGFSATQIGVACELILADRLDFGAPEPPVDLVTSGPDAPGIANRDTAVVVRELFAHAEQTVLVIGYAVCQGQRVFRELATRMDERPGLQVQFFLNISRPDRDTAPPEILVSRFARRFRERQWPAGSRLPEVFYDPRSLADLGTVRSSLHAKCVVVDSRHVFVSSANFTEAGQKRNIEVGLKIESRSLARQITAHFRQLHAHGLAQKAF